MNETAQQYERFRPGNSAGEHEIQRQMAYQRKNVLPLLAGLSANSHIVEIGPGDGTTARLLKEQGFTSYRAIEVCQAYAEGMKKAGYNCVHAQSAVACLETEWPDGSIDALIAIDVLEHMEFNECLELLAVARRKLRPGGVCIFQVPNSSGLFGMNTYLADPTHRLPFNETRLHSMLRSSGFENVQVLPVELPGSLPNVLRRTVQSVAFLLIRLLTRLVGATPVRVLTHLMIGVAKTPAQT